MGSIFQVTKQLLRPSPHIFVLFKKKGKSNRQGGFFPLLRLLEFLSLTSTFISFTTTPTF